MTEHEASRTLVKSPPELWAECSDASSLARHLGEFGEIKITRLEPETTVAWEGELASGTVSIEPSAWGTRVTLRARVEEEEVSSVAPPPAAERVPEPEPEPEPVLPETAPLVVTAARETGPVPETSLPPERPPRGFLARWRARFKAVPAPPSPQAAPAPPSPPAAPAPPVSTPTHEDVVAPEPEAALPPEPKRQPEPQAAMPPTSQVDPEAALTAALDSLGQAHHRPFSRA